MIFSRVLGFTLFSMYILFLSLQHNGVRALLQNLDGNYTVLIPCLLFLILFLFHDMYIQWVAIKKFITSKFGVHIECSKRKLEDASSGSRTGTESMKVDKRIHVFCKTPIKYEFKSQRIWVPYQLDTQSIHHGAGVIGTPKTVKVSFLPSLPFIHHVDVGFIDKEFLTPRRKFNIWVDGWIVLVNLAIWGYLVYSFYGEA